MVLTSTALGNGLVEFRTYRTDNRLASIATSGINQLTDTYDANERVTNEANPLLPAEALTCGYDVEDRLTTFKRGPTATPTATPTQSQSWNLSLVTLTQNGQTPQLEHGESPLCVIYTWCVSRVSIPRINFETKSSVGR